ncbi:hypothetical protein BX600DRAFT_527839 [Xylariales sp. PMI_506]|nr:hypothetical protein BX600DRAFT_527839 [Xylariales sp. PMI_506]
MAWTYNTSDSVPTTGPLISAIAIVFTGLSLLVILLRGYVRIFLINAVGADDWMVLCTWIASCGFAIVTIFQTKWGLGLQSVDDMPDQNIYTFGLLQYIGAPFYISSILGFKLSLLLSYLRFIITTRYRTFTIVIAVLSTLFHLSFLLVQLNLCQPVAKQWDPSITWGSCITAVPFYTSMASLTIVFDVIVLFLPFPVLVRSQIQIRRKVVLLGLFALGLFITVIQIVRIQTIKSLANYLDSGGLIMWSTVENNLGIIVTSVPTLAPLIKYFSEKSRAGESATAGASAYGGRGGSGSYALRSWRAGRNDAQFLGAGVDIQTTDVVAKGSHGGLQTYLAVAKNIILHFEEDDDLKHNKRAC